MAAGYQHAPPAGVKNQAVVSALQTRLDHPAKRERRAPMRAAIFERGDLARRGSEQHHRLV